MIRSARAEVRGRVWQLAGTKGPAADGQVTVDIDGVLVIAHSDKQDAAPIWKKSFGHHPLLAFVDHGQDGSDRIRTARATGLRNLPLHDFAQNRLWLEIVSLALDLLAWMPMLALTGAARRWEVKKLRLRPFSTAGQPVTAGRRQRLRLTRT